MDSKKGCLEVLYRECWHNLRAPISRSRTSNNPGRLFWGCPLWRTNDCQFFEWLPRDAAATYMKLHGLEGVEVVDKADTLKWMDEQRDVISKLIDENRTLVLRHEAILKQATRSTSPASDLKEGQKIALFCLVFGLLMGFICGLLLGFILRGM